jgi:hypothetical protein
MNQGGVSSVLSVTLSCILTTARSTCRGLLLLVLPWSAAFGSSLTLAWNDNSSDEAGFKIERATGGGTDYAQIATVGSNTTSYIDGDLSSGLQYSYRVRAYNAAGDSAYSNVVSYTTPGTNTAPIIGSISSATIDANTATSALGFTVGDAETSADALAVSGKSSNQTLIPDSNLFFGGSGSSRTITVTPAANQTGTASITVTVSDGLLTASTTFSVTVNALVVAPSNTAPTITALSDQTINVNGSSSQSFKVSDAESASGGLSVTGSSSNTSLVPASAITFATKGANRTVTVKPATNQTGTATIRVTVSDGSLTASSSFVLTVNGSTSNSSPTITSIDDQVVSSGTSTSALPFTVGDAETAAGNLTLSGSSSNTTFVPTSGIQFGGSGSSRTVTVSTASGQTGSATITVTVSDGSLHTSTSFVVSTSTTTSTKLGNNAPTISAIADQSIAQNTSTSSLGFTIGDAETAASKLSLSANSSNPTLVPSSGIKFGGKDADRTVTVTPARGQTGTALITVAVQDAGGLVATTSFLVTVAASNEGPQISGQPQSQTVKAGATATFTVTAAGSPPPSYQWRKGGIAIAGATSASLTLSNVQTDATGAYDVVVSNNKGSMTSSVAILAVNLESLEGTYSGKFSDGGDWMLYVRSDYTATLIANVPSRGLTVVLDLVIAPDGTFTVTNTQVNSLASGTVQASSWDGDGGSTRFVSAKKITVSGRIAGGQVAGEFSDFGLTFSGAIDAATGPLQTLAGYSTAVSDSGQVYSIVGSSGKTIMVVASGGRIDVATGVTQASGAFSGVTSQGGIVSSQIDPQKLTVAVSYTAPGASAPVAFAGRNEQAPSASRFVNVSIRTKAGSGSSTLITGFVIRGEAPKPILIRGIGPTLGDYGVSGALADPILSLFRGQSLAESNDNWGNANSAAHVVATNHRVGAFPLKDNSRDAVVVTSLTDGAYTAHVSGNGGAEGVALIELYDADTKGNSRLVNVSARSHVGTGGDVMIVGFVIAGEGPRQVMIRAVGPTLAATYGLPGALVDPTLRLFRGETVLEQNDDWGGSATLTAAFSKAGAFQFSSPDSRDATILVTLPPGAYTAMVAGANGGTGVALLELYEMP